MLTESSREYSGRVCAWCRGPIRPDARRDSICCSTRCRQARNRFVQGVGTPPPVAGGQPLRLAYADPPYPGKSRRYYSDHPDYAGEVDHAELISRLAAEFDGWALSTSAEALPDVLRLCPPGTRVAAWHRGERTNVAALRPQNAWEPVLYAGGRLRVADPRETVAAAKRDASSRTSATAPVVRDATTRSAHQVDADARRGLPRRIDSLVYHPGNRITDPARVVGAKPAVFIRWIFDLLGALPGDEFVDVFPGSGGVSRAWELYCSEAAR